MQRWFATCAHRSPSPLSPSHIAAVLRVQTEAFQAANVALGQMRTAALPAPSDMAGVPTGVAASIPSTPEALTSGRDATPPHLQVCLWGMRREQSARACHPAASASGCMQPCSPALHPACRLHARRFACAPRPQANMNDVTRKLQRKDINGGSMAVSASALGSKDSLYTIQDAPAAPQHRIPAAPSQVGVPARVGSRGGLCTVRSWKRAGGDAASGGAWAGLLRHPNSFAAPLTPLACHLHLLPCRGGTTATASRRTAAAQCRRHGRQQACSSAAPSVLALGSARPCQAAAQPGSTAPFVPTYQHLTASPFVACVSYS